jgi:hypothetical protein
MTVLERLKAAGYDPAKAITQHLTAGTGEMECARIVINTFRGLPFERNILVVAATAFTVLPDGSYGPYPEYWTHYLEASAHLYFPLDAEFGSCEIDLQNRSEHDRYVLLDRLLQDCKYFLGAGRRSDAYLWAGNVQSQAQTMRSLWASFPEDCKPTWTTLEKINQYVEEMQRCEIY